MKTGEAQGLDSTMETEYSTALATLKSDPVNPSALEVLTNLHPGNGSGVDRETLSAALAAARGWHSEHGDAALVVQLLDVELSWTPGGAYRADLLVDKARLLDQELLHFEEARAAVNEALETAPGHRAAAELSRKLDEAESEWEAQAQQKVSQAKSAGERPSAAPAWAAAGELFLKFRPKAKEGEAFLRRAVELDPRQKRADLILERVLREGRRYDDLVELVDRRVATAPSADERAAAEALAGALAEEL